MSERGREIVLARIRAALGDRPKDHAGSIEPRLSEPPVGPRPTLSADMVEAFITKARANLFAVERIASHEELPPAVQTLFGEASSAPDISVAPALAQLGWPAEWRVKSGAGRRTERLSVTPAIAGIAETGSVVLRSGPSTPTSLNFLPDIHVVVLRTSDIVAYAEDVWTRLRADGGDWPRTVNVISGPSRTADVGGIVVRPAHGPKAVHLVLVEE